MFLHKSFSRKSFHPESWKGFEIVLPPVAGGGGGGAHGVDGYKKIRPIVIDGDDTDVRHIEPTNVVVAVYAKGQAKRDTGGFVQIKGRDY